MTKFNEYVLRFGLTLGFGVALGGVLIHQTWPWLVYFMAISLCLSVDIYLLFGRMFPPKMKQWTVTMKHHDEPLTHVVEERARTAKEAADWALIKHKEPDERWNWTATAKPWKTAEEYAEDEHAEYIIRQVMERAKTEKISLWKSATTTINTMALEAGRKIYWHTRLYSVFLLWFATWVARMRDKGETSHDAQH